MILTHGANSIRSGGTPLPEGYESLDKITFTGWDSSLAINFDSPILQNHQTISTGLEISLNLDSSGIGSGLFYYLFNGSVVNQTECAFADAYNRTFLRIGGSPINWDLTSYVGQDIKLKYDRGFLSFAEYSGSVYFSDVPADKIVIGPWPTTNMDVYEINLLDGNSVIFHGVPAKRLADGKTGIYNVLENTFHVLNV